MASNVQTLPISDATDGTGAVPTLSAMVQNDSYYLDKIAEVWAKDRSLPPGTYRLARLPGGYGGFEKQRGESKHVDRYLYGHPRGVFRSVNELYPHFKHLQEFEGPIGCPCKLCITGSSRSKSQGTTATKNANLLTRPAAVKSSSKKSNGDAFRNPPQISTTSPYFDGMRPSGPAFGGLPEGRCGSSDPPTSRLLQVDDNGTQDVYRMLLDKLKQAGSQGCPVTAIQDKMSPDWWTGHESLTAAITACKKLPTWVPREGEVVLFTRTDDRVEWDTQANTFRCFDAHNHGNWLEIPRWEAGVVTKLPVQELSPVDLKEMASTGDQSLSYSGFRIEPLSPLQREGPKKPPIVRHKHVPLHAIRPFFLWQECLRGVNEEAWHPNIHHALAAASSFTIVSRYAFKGTWPEATVFAEGLYMGAELILVGDAVRLLPRDVMSNPLLSKPEISKPENIGPVLDIMIITSIRLEFVNLDEAADDDYDDDQPYTTVLHIQGKAFTLDVSRSFDMSGKTSLARPGVDIPVGLAAYGSWYHMLDTSNPKQRLEVPYTRLLGRCHDYTTLQNWFVPAATLPPPPDPNAAAFQPVNTPVATAPIPSPVPNTTSLSSGLIPILAARAFGACNDPRISSATQSGNDDPASQSLVCNAWFWADSRIEQLALPEVNGKFVGEWDPLRSDVSQLRAWHKAIKVLDARKPNVKEGVAPGAGTSGDQQASNGNAGNDDENESSGEEDDEDDQGDDDGMEVDPMMKNMLISPREGGGLVNLRGTGGGDPILLNDDDDDDDDMHMTG